MPMFLLLPVFCSHFVYFLPFSNLEVEVLSGMEAAVCLFVCFVFMSLELFVCFHVCGICLLVSKPVFC